LVRLLSNGAPYILSMYKQSIFPRILLSYHRPVPRFEPDSAVIPSEPSPTLDSTTMANINAPEPELRIFSAPQEIQPPTSTRAYRQRMKFSPTPIMRGNDTEEIHLPSIYDFAPAKWDNDVKDALQTTYYSHVISLSDHVRYCKEKGFFRLITAFQGTMTVPVQKLFLHEDIAPWIKACDFLMYQKIIRFLAPLTLQVIPPKVMRFLVSVSKLLHSHITNTFSNSLPKHTLDAKLEPATVFCQLLERMIRTNQTAHAAGVALVEDVNRQRMWAEYVELVQPKCMMNAFLPDCGYDEEVYKLLTQDIRRLLLPLATNPTLELNTHYQLAAEIQNSQPQPESFELDKIGDFLESLKARFPTVQSRDLLHYIQGVTSYILRDITMENGQSYTCWLLTKCFVDELALWLVHAGGFLEHNPLSPLRCNAQANGSTGIPNSTSSMSGNMGSASPSRQNSVSDIATNVTQNLNHAVGGNPGLSKAQDTTDHCRSTWATICQSNANRC
jgi:regulatory factor X 1/2/3